MIANSELGLLTNKLAGEIQHDGIFRSFISLYLCAGYERDLELERRKNRDLVEAAKDKDTEYQKLKVRHTKIQSLIPSQIPAFGALSFRRFPCDN